jgi:hypothetical protein
MKMDFKGNDPREQEEELTERETTCLARLRSSLAEVRGELSREAATRLVLLLALEQLRRLHPLVAAGWTGDEPGSHHLDAIRRSASEIAVAGEGLPPSNPRQAEPGNRRMNGDPE